ncbi:DUF3570 domain-containing protein [Ferruginibacter paludis]|uniref:DUF3570 domain-containing protein n=1 Tax=Ferruginibacter paludis TaxID=1310417 RepID=UPI0025B5256B|nr:DUF3570 domain-containing protein [Ferruginibacter paludis]MDN3655185.1 DUF3570 domain-containing protein [Ferruginibacter paludis]
MKKVCLTVIGLYLLLLNAFSQAVTKDTAAHAAKEETVEYVDKPLHLEETNIVSSYYNQNGNHSAVTGGIGTEKVTDLSNGLELKFTGADVEGHKYTLTTGLGFDHHSSASSAYVNKTGASKTGGSRVYPSIDFSVENKKGSTFGFGAYYSAEYNYHSFALDASYSRKIGKGGELSGKASAYFDKVKLIYPSELIPATTTVVTTVTSASGGGGGSYDEEGGRAAIPSSPRYTYTGSLAYTQVINKNMQAALLMDVVGQNGYLSLPFHRVYLSDGTVHAENLPVQRYKLPIGFRLNYFAGDKVIIRSYYRYFTDDWGIKAHTASLEIPVKISPFFSVSPFYRYYTQTASTYFAPYQKHATSDTYYTSNYAYSAFNSAYYGVGLHIAPPGGLWKSALSSLEIRYGHYTQTTDLNSNIISFNFQFKH